MSDTKSVPVSSNARAILLAMKAENERLNMALNSYVNGLKEGMGLEGVWQLDIASLTFIKQDEPKKDG